MTAKATKPTNYEIVKSLFPTTPATWDSRINLESQEYWNASKTVIADDNFSPVRNQIFDALINRIGLTIVRQRNFANPLSMFKQGFMPFGDTMQEIAVDVTEAHQYKTGNAPQFETADPKVRTAYHRVNRQQFYKTTVYDTQLQYAFTEEYGLSTLINTIVSTLQSSNTIDEFLYTKRLISSFFKNEEYPVKPSQIITVPRISQRPRSQTDLQYFLEDVKKVLRKMQFPSRNYNAANQMTQVTPDDLVLVLNSDIVAINEVTNLAFAFNPEYMNLNIPILSVDQIDASDPTVIGAIVSRTSFDIRTTKEVFTVAENAQALYTNYFYHIHQIYTASPFETLAFIKEGDAD